MVFYKRKVLSKYRGIVLSVILGIILTTFLGFIDLIYGQSYYMENLTNRAYEFKTNKEDICKVLYCIPPNDYYIHHLPGDINIAFSKYDYDFKLVTYNESIGIYYPIYTGDSTRYIYPLLVYILITILVFVIPLYNIIRKEQDDLLLSKRTDEMLVINKSMIHIAENIHHELNTPLEVIDNKLEKIHRVFLRFIKEEEEFTKHINTIPIDRIDRNKKISSLQKDFDFIKTSSEQIYVVLNRMKTFKNLRYSNGNKSIYDIIEGALTIISAKYSNFSYKIDEELFLYSLTDLPNAALLGIILNHIKNSVEANSTNIKISLEDVKKNFIYINIKDDGTGIPKDIVKDIFLPNVTTKEGIRGNGLSVNSTMIAKSKGNIRLVKTNAKGTTFEIKIPIKNKEH